jgi:hypothetical protein
VTAEPPPCAAPHLSWDTVMVVTCSCATSQSSSQATLVVSKWLVGSS